MSYHETTSTDPLTGMIQLIGGRWKLMIMRELTAGPRRFGDLRRSLGDISQKVLTDALRTMEEDGLIHRVVYPEVTLHVEYSLTALGYEMTALLRTMTSCYANYITTVENIERSPRQAEAAAFYKTSSAAVTVDLPDYKTRIQTAKALMAEADYIIAGTGSGINVASNINLFDKKTAKRLFPAYYEQGFNCIDDMINAFSQISPENELAYWDFWSEYLWEFRYRHPASQAHLDLFHILKDKSHFVVSSNADGQLEKTGLDLKHIYLPLGSYSYLQCAFPCEEKVYDAQPYIEKILADTDSGIGIRPESIPRCPSCGDYLVPNHYRCRNVSLASADRLAHRKDFLNFLNHSLGKRVVFLEIGSGFRLQNIIRRPCEDFTRKNERACLIRINSKFPQITDERLLEHALSFGENEAEVLHDLAYEGPLNPTDNAHP